jgi:hypothetical protein
MTKRNIDNLLNGVGVDSFNRFQIFLNFARDTKKSNYWYALRSAYTQSDNLYYLRDYVRKSFLWNELVKCGLSAMLLQMHLLAAWLQMLYLFLCLNKTNASIQPIISPVNI